MIRSITIRSNILTNFLFVVIVVAAGLLGMQYYFAREMAIDAAEKTFLQLAGKVTAVMQDRDKLAKETLNLIEGYPGLQKPPTFRDRHDLLRRLSIPMKNNPTVYAVYMGYGNGDFFEVANLRSGPKVMSTYRAPATARWLMIRVSTREGKRIRRFDFFDENYVHLATRQNVSMYDATKRPWYKQAMRSSKAVRSDPYLFSNLQAQGITFSKKLSDGKTVLALDITLDTLHTLFRQLKFAPDSEISMLGREGRIIVSSETGPTKLETVLEGKTKMTGVGGMLRFDEDGRTWLAMLQPFSSEEGEMTLLGFSIDETTMLKPYVEKIYPEIGAGIVLLILLLPLILYTTGRIVRPIRLLTDETDKIKARRFEEVVAVRTNIIELRALSGSLVSMSASIREYQEAQKAMMDSFIKIIADAIDTKSPYTGGHCKRVPVIAMMLAEAAGAQTEGLFASFTFESKEAREEFERGAWLHDCGKITTPEYVVDKSTKLETIYNRIHEVRTRFEVIWRDVEIAYYERLLAGEEKSVLDAWKAQEHETLLEEFAFIAKANMGGEFMSEALKARVHAIAARTWTRHFDDRIGLSDNELMRYEGVPVRPAPAQEKLLDDKQEHRIKRENFDEAGYRAQGFKTPVPELLYDYGELYNLCIDKGTLTEEERFKINEHIIMSIKMLEQMPLPENMQMIPYYAGTHHETLDGRGYPRQLDRHALTTAARITAIADIYEALTASDRPYKKAKTLSQTLEIMARMVDEQHIDGDLFALFLRSGVYREYAQQYLKPDQIDEVDIEDYLVKRG